MLLNLLARYTKLVLSKETMTDQGRFEPNVPHSGNDSGLRRKCALGGLRGAESAGLPPVARSHWMHNHQ